MISHDEIMTMREHVFRHGMVLMEKIKKMFDVGELTQSQMDFAADVLKDLSKMDCNMAKACYYDSKRGVSSDKTY